jgi:hypothetical protein
MPTEILEVDTFFLFNFELRDYHDEVGHHLLVQDAPNLIKTYVVSIHVLLTTLLLVVSGCCFCQRLGHKQGRYYDSDCPGGGRTKHITSHGEPLFCFHADAFPAVIKHAAVASGLIEGFLPEDSID